MSDVALQLPAGANFPLNNSALAYALTSRVATRAKCSQSSTDSTSNRIEFLAVTESSKCTCSSCKQRFNWLHNELGKPCMISAKRLDVLCATNKDNFLLPLINMKRLRGNTLPILWQETTTCTITSCRCKFRQLEQEAGARFHQIPRELLSRFSQEANQALDNQ